MNLDPKIKDLSKIYNVFNCNSVTGNKQGYFANSLSAFSDLKNCVDGNLVAIDNDSESPFLSGVVDGGCIIKGNFSFFTSVDNVKSEKKLRPFKLQEFIDKFGFGSRIRYRHKSNVCVYTGIFNGYEEYNDSSVCVCIGVHSISLQMLFEEYEFQTAYTEDYEPFGVEEWN